MDKKLTAFCSIGLVALAAIARADTPGVDLSPGQFYAIDHCPQISGGCSGTTIGADGQGSVSIQTAAGETIDFRIGGVQISFSESFGPAPEDANTTVFGRLNAGSISTTPARTVYADTLVGRIDATILVDTTAGDVTISLPMAQYNAGRRITVKKISSGNSVNVQASSIDGAPVLTLADRWQFVTVEGTPAGSKVTGFTTDEWSIVGH